MKKTILEWLYNLKQYKEIFDNKILTEEEYYQYKMFCDNFCQTTQQRRDKIKIILGLLKSNNNDWVGTYHKMKKCAIPVTQEYFNLLYGEEGNQKYDEYIKMRNNNLNHTSEKQRERVYKLIEKKKNNPYMNTCRLEYYMNKGMTEEEAKIALKNRQSTFSLEKCIKKYGEIEGKNKWEERQEKWQSKLKNKSNEELEEILIRKMNGFKQYSKISQELFNQIYEQIKNKNYDIYYATLKRDDMPKRISNYEYYYKNEKRGVLLDFYIKDLNKVIEYDGEYWHKQHKNDEERKKFLKDNGFKVLYIMDKEYKNNKNEILKKCLEWILNDD